MADDSDVIAADSIDLELEAMKNDDYSWHPCQVHLSPDGDGLVIKYGNNGSEEILVNEKEALTRLRVRSLPLKEDDCTHIKEGKHVVVNRDSESESRLFDAEVEKVSRVRHSKRMNCRCTFMIKWLHQDLHSGSLTVPSSSIMRLSNQSITNHPIISAFIDAMSLNVVNDIDLDLHDLLEKQIEGIRNSVNGSKKKIRDEILGFEANTHGQLKETNISTSNVRDPKTQISSDKTRLRRSTRSQQSIQRAEVKQPTSPVIPSPSIEEELPDIKSPLNPLAARAALASLMSKTLEFSLDHEEPNGFSEFSLKVTDFSTNGTQLRQDNHTSPDDNFERSSRVVRNKSITVTNRRVTRSLLHKDGEIKTIKNDIISDHKVVAEESDKNNIFTTPLPASEIDSVPTTRRKIPFKMEEGIEGMKNSSNMRRVTRSLVNKEVENIKMESVKEAGSEEFSRNEAINLPFCSEETNGKIDSLPTKGRNKKRNITTQDSEGYVTSNGSRKNSRNLKKHEVLRSSPRTRSQNKA